MKNYIIPLLLHLSLHTLTTAKIHTFTQGDPNSYIGDISKAPKIGPKDIDVKDDGDLHIIFGEELSKKLMDTAKKHCKDPENDECKKQIQEIMGLGTSENIIQRRMAPVLVLGAIPILGYAAYKTVTYLGGMLMDRLEKSLEYKVVYIKFPKNQKEEVGNWDMGNEDKFLFKPEQGEPVEVPIHDDVAVPQPSVKINKEDDGDITVILPGHIIPSIEQSWNTAKCGQSGMKRSLEKRFTMLDIVRCAEAIQRVAQLGGPAAEIQDLDPSLFPKFHTELTVESLEESKTYGKKLYYSRRLSSKQRDNIATVSTWISAGYLLGNQKFKDSRMVFSQQFLELQDAMDEEDDEECPKGDKRMFCSNCGGNAKVDDNSPYNPAERKERLGTCKGVRNGDESILQGCECFQDSRPFYQTLNIDEAQKAFEYLQNLPDQTDDKNDDKKDDDKDDDKDKGDKPQKTCYKEDANSMKDHKKWRFVRQTKLDDAIKSYCDGWKATDKGAVDVETKKTFYENDDDDWDAVDLVVIEAKGATVDTFRCQYMFQSISSCDYDKNNEASIARNQFNYKWGGELKHPDGVTIKVLPKRDRVWTDTVPDDGVHSCTNGKMFSELNGGKGKNGLELDDSARMTLTMCIHHMRNVPENLDVDCGGLLQLKMYRWSYGSKTDCTNNTWKCLSHQVVEVGRLSKGKHYPGFASCEARLWYQGIPDK